MWSSRSITGSRRSKSIRPLSTMHSRLSNGRPQAALVQLHRAGIRPAGTAMSGLPVGQVLGVAAPFANVLLSEAVKAGMVGGKSTDGLDPARSTTVNTCHLGTSMPSRGFHPIRAG
jgi:hypothetical protein